MTENLVPLDLTRFTAADADKIAALRNKVTMMRRWCRCDLVEKNGHPQYMLYSGDRGSQPYASYLIRRDDSGRYLLLDGRSGETLHTGRTIDSAIDALPEDFYFARY